MKQVSFRNRRALQIESELIRLTTVIEGGHIAEITHKRTGINPLWVPPWPSIEPSVYSPSKHPEYGTASEGRLLSGILGHNLCLDLFGPPSDQEAAAGIPLHGETNTVEWTFTERSNGLTGSCVLPGSQLRFTREIQLLGDEVQFAETVENLSPFDRPIAWTEHVTLGPPFLDRGTTEFRTSATRSRTIGTPSIDFDWPRLPESDGQFKNLERYTNAAASGGFSTHLMDPSKDVGYFIAYSPKSEVLVAYLWRREDFPWLGMWEENHLRIHSPWDGRTMTCGLEFSASPFPETRREMIDRNRLFDTPCYRWIPGKSSVGVQFRAIVRTAKAIPADHTALL